MFLVIERTIHPETYGIWVCEYEYQAVEKMMREVYESIVFLEGKWEVVTAWNRAKVVVLRRRGKTVHVYAITGEMSNADVKELIMKMLENHEDVAIWKEGEW